MRPTLRRLAVTSATTLMASGLAVPLTTSPATAVTLTTTTVTVADTDDDGSFELWVKPEGGTGTALVKNYWVDVADVTVSADGSRLAAVLWTASPTSENVSAKLQVFDIGGRSVRVVESAVMTPTGGSVILDPTLSPDGSTVVYSVISSSGTVIKRAAVASGAGVSTGLSGVAATFLDSTTLLAAGSTGWFTAPSAGGTTKPVTGIPAAAYDVKVSPDGGKLAWVLDTSTDTEDLGEVQVAALSLTDGAASVGTPTTVSTGANDISPAFSRDSASVSFVRIDPEWWVGDVWSAPADGSSPAALTSETAADEYEIAFGARDDSAPAAATALPAVLDSGKALVRWALPADADVAGVVLSRSGKSVYVAAPATSYQDSGLSFGASYTYTIQAFDRSGNAASTASRTITAWSSAPNFASPTSSRFTKAPFAVGFGQNAPSGSVFWVDYLPAGSTTWKPWVTGAAGTIRTFGVASTTPNVNSTSVVIGGTYAFRVRGQDPAGNTTALRTVGNAVVPYDHTRATFSGGTTVTTAAAWLGSWRNLRTTASYAKVTLVGKKLQVIGTRCTACGKFDIFEGSKLLATVDTYHSSTFPRAVLYTRYYTTSGTHTYTIRPKATPGRPSVNLDGFAMLR